ncbi:MAG: trigger factor [Candidatus Omnitrophota bacterium]
MKSNIKKLKNCKRVVEVKVSSDKVKDEFEKVYQGLKNVANIPGYRVGKAPRDLLEQHYSNTAKEEVIKRLVPDTYRSLLEEHKLDPIGYPDISDVSLDKDGNFSYKATIETRPDFTLKNYKGLKLNKKKLEVKEEEVGKNLEALREQSANSVPKKDSDEKDKVLPKLDDEFAKDLGLENLEKLREAIRENLKQRKEIDIQADLELQIIDQLVANVNFDIPDSLFNAEKNRLLKDANSRVAYMEAIQKKSNPDKKFSLSDKDKSELEENATKQANRQIKAFFILDKIAQQEKIHLNEDDIEKKIEEMSTQYNKPKEEIRKQLEKNNMLDEIALNMRNKKVMDFLLKEATIKEG